MYSKDSLPLILSFQPAPELVIIPSKKSQALGSSDKQEVKTDTAAVKEAFVQEVKEEVQDRREDRQDTRDDKQLIVPESEEDEKERRRRRKKEKKEKKRRKREEREREKERSRERSSERSRERDISRERIEKEDKHGRDRNEISAAVSSKEGREKDEREMSEPGAVIVQQKDLRFEEKLNNINSPGQTVDKEPKVKFSFGDIVSQARSIKESASVMRRSSLLNDPPKVEFHRADTQDSFQDTEGGIFDFPPSARQSQTSWSPRGTGYNLGEPESSDEENVSPKSPSFFRSKSRDIGSDTSMSDENSRRKLRRRVSRKEKKKKRYNSDSD